MEKMKGMREDAKKGQGSNSGAVEGANNLQNWGSLNLIPTDLETKRPTEGGLGTARAEDMTMRCADFREINVELSQGLLKSLTDLDLEGRKSGSKHINRGKVSGMVIYSATATEPLREVLTPEEGLNESQNQCQGVLDQNPG